MNWVATMEAMALTATELARLTGGRLDGAAPLGPLPGLVADSRELTAGGAFWALRGEQADGHAFVADAAARGASLAVVDERWPATPGARPAALLRVDDTTAALRRSCSARLAELGCTVVAVTGSVGKTTAKELIAHVLGGRLRAGRTAGNLNTWTGVPLSVLRLEAPLDVFVAELAMTAPGEIAALAAMTHPRLGVLLNVGLSHLELLGSPEAIAAAKAELLAALPADGAAVCNADDPVVRRLAASSPAPVRWFGLDAADAAFTARDIRADGLRGSRFTLCVPSGSLPAELPVPGRHLVLAACAAVAVADALGVDLAAAAERLSSFVAPPQRGVVRVGARGATVYDDSYNSAPASLAAAFEVLASSGAARRVAVIGDMLELGEETVTAHEGAGREAAAAATVLIAVGEQAGRMVAAAVAAGLPAERAHVAADVDEAAMLALAECSPQTAVLVKASHGVALERVVARLVS